MSVPTDWCLYLIASNLESERFPKDFKEIWVFASCCSSPVIATVHKCRILSHSIGCHIVSRVTESDSSVSDLEWKRKFYIWLVYVMTVLYRTNTEFNATATALAAVISIQKTFDLCMQKKTKKNAHTNREYQQQSTNILLCKFSTNQSIANHTTQRIRRFFGILRCDELLLLLLQTV